MYTPCLGREVAPVQGWKLAVPMPSRFEPSASPHRSRPPRGPAGITWPMRQLTANLGLGLAAYVRFSFCSWGDPPLRSMYLFRIISASEVPARVAVHFRMCAKGVVASGMAW